MVKVKERTNSYVETFEARGHDYNEATSNFPHARENERQAVLSRLRCKPGHTIGDAPAGGGYVADGLHASMAGEINIVCIEPSKKFAAAITGPYTVLLDPLDSVSLPDASLDGIVSLAGMHHLDDKLPVYREWHRLIKPGGCLAIADVGSDTGTSEFLNGFVHANTPGGHRGIFIEADEFSQQLSQAGFEVLEEALETVPWVFPDRAAMGNFCKTLFSAKKAAPAEVADAMDAVIGSDMQADGSIHLRWQLRCATAIKC